MSTTENGQTAGKATTTTTMKKKKENPPSIVEKSSVASSSPAAAAAKTTTETTTAKSSTAKATATTTKTTTTGTPPKSKGPSSSPVGKENGVTPTTAKTDEGGGGGGGGGVEVVSTETTTTREQRHRQQQQQRQGHQTPSTNVVLRIAVGSTNPSKIRAVENALQRLVDESPASPISSHSNKKKKKKKVGSYSPYNNDDEDSDSEGGFAGENGGRGKSSSSSSSSDIVSVSFDIEGFDVDSGVSDQPYGDHETVHGAKTRARGAYLAYRRAHDGASPHLAIGMEGGLEWVSLGGYRVEEDEDDGDDDDHETGDDDGHHHDDGHRDDAEKGTSGTDRKGKIDENIEGIQESPVSNGVVRNGATEGTKNGAKGHLRKDGQKSPTKKVAKDSNSKKIVGGAKRTKNTTAGSSSSPPRSKTAATSAANVPKDAGADDGSGKEECLFCMAWMAVYGKRSPLLVEVFASPRIKAYYGDRKPVYGTSKTACLPLPRALTNLIVKGNMELGDADDVVFGRIQSKRGEGTVGLLTEGVVDRSAFYEHAVLLAMTPWIRPDIYHLPKYAPDITAAASTAS